MLIIWPVFMSKKILITGCAQGIGKYLSANLAKSGYKIIGLDRQSYENLNQDVRESLINYHTFDLSNIQELPEFCRRLVLENNGIDVLINNAGIKYFDFLKETDYSIITNVTNVNFLAPIILVKELFNFWGITYSGKIINISSNAAFEGYSKGSLYCSTKAGLLIFGEAFSKELTNSKVSVTTICPATLLTEEYLEKYPNISRRGLISVEELFTVVQKEINSSKSNIILLSGYRQKLRYILKYLKTQINLLMFSNEI